MVRSFLLFLLLLSILTSIPVAAAVVNPQLDFADHLFAEGDYYRAVTEYKRFLFQHPEDPAAPVAILRMVRSFIAGERWDEAETQLTLLQEKWPTSPEARRGALLYAEIPFRQGDYALARERYSLLESRDPQLQAAARYRIAWTHIEQGDYPAAETQLRLLHDPAAEGLAADLPPLEHLPEKSPGLAGSLSAVLPGAGQLYVGRKRDAALAFTLNAAFILAAIEAFDNDNHVLGGILVFFELGWYTGNIYNATNSAHKHNRRLHEDERKKLRNRHGLDLAVAPETAMLTWTRSF
jgi:tetratricopeptide (TPR) repeat protein